MQKKQYDIFLDETIIGTTALEKVDAPMGVVFGRINFINTSSGYDFIKTYCVANNITFTDYPEDKFISTMNISNLKVFSSIDNEIIGQGCEISGMDDEGFDITIIGIPYPFYETEFPEHVGDYSNKSTQIA